MKRLLVFLLLVGAGSAFLWHAYQVGWLRSPLRGGQASMAYDAGDQRSAAASTPQEEGAGGQASHGRWRRGTEGAGGRFATGEDGGPIPVLAEPARYEDVPVTLDAVGTIQALNTVTVRSQVDGRLIALEFKDGQDVKRGDVLARIDPTTYQAQYDQAVAKKAQDEAQLANARVDLERYAKLATTEYGSRQQADTQKALVAQLQAQTKVDQGVIDNDKAILDYTIIKSPIEGRTGIRLIDAGNIVHATDQTGIVVIAQLQPIAMIFNLPQQHLGVVNAAMAKGPVAVEVLDSDNTRVIDKGTVEVVDNQVDQTTGTVKIKATFPNGDRRLWPGQFVNVRLFVDVIPRAVVIPTAAVQRGPNGAYVYVVEGGATVKLTPVSVGQQDENKAVVRSGLEPPAEVVTTGFARLTDGARVTVAEQEPPAAPAPPGESRANAEPPPGSGTAAGQDAQSSSQAAGAAAGPGGQARRHHRHSQQQSPASPTDPPQ